MSLRTELDAYLREREVDFVGVTTVSAFQLANGDRMDPKALMPEGRSLVVTGFYPCVDDPCVPSEPGKPRGRFGPWTRLSVPAIRHQINVVTGFFRERGFRMEACPDIPAKAAAVRAGWGKYGKNCIVHAKGCGSYVKIQPFLTDAELEAVEMPIETSDCGNCRACVEACPTGALKTPYVLDRSKCICMWLWGTSIPREMRRHVGNHLHRCSYCQEACPLNARLAPREHLPFEMEGPTASPELIPLMLGDEAFLRSRLPGFVMSAGVATVRRNIAMALGNVGDPAGIPALAKGMMDPEKVVRSYSAGALGEIGGQEARRELERALIREEDDEVREEIRVACAS